MAAKPSSDDPRFEYARERLQETKGDLATSTLQKEAKDKFGKYLSQQQVGRVRAELGLPPWSPRRGKKERHRNGVEEGATETVSGNAVLETLIRQIGSKLQKVAQRFELSAITLTYREGSGTSWTFREPAPERTGRL